MNHGTYLYTIEGSYIYPIDVYDNHAGGRVYVSKELIGDVEPVIFDTNMVRIDDIKICLDHEYNILKRGK